MAVRRKNPDEKGEGHAKRPSGCGKCFDGWVTIYVLWNRKADGRSTKQRLTKEQYIELLGEAPARRTRTVTDEDGRQREQQFGKFLPRVSRLDPRTQRVYEAVEGCGCEAGRFMEATFNEEGRKAGWDRDQLSSSRANQATPAPTAVYDAKAAAANEEALF